MRDDRFQFRRGARELRKIRARTFQCSTGFECLLHRVRRGEQFAVAAEASFGHLEGGEVVERRAARQRLEVDEHRAAGGDPDVNRRLPSRLTARGFQIDALTPLPVLGGEGSMAAQWLQRFVAVYAAQLMAQGLWSADDQAEADAEMAAAQTDPGSYWVGPTVLELRATR